MCFSADAQHNMVRSIQYFMAYNLKVNDNFCINESENMTSVPLIALYDLSLLCYIFFQVTSLHKRF